MAVRLYNAPAEAACDTVGGRIDAGASAGRVEIRDGSQPAVNGALTGNILCTFDFSDPALGAASANGTNADAAANGLPKTDPSAANSGTAAYGVILDSDDNVILTGTVTATGGGGDFEIDNINIEADQEVQLTGYTLRLPQQGA